MPLLVRIAVSWMGDGASVSVDRSCETVSVTIAWVSVTLVEDVVVGASVGETAIWVVSYGWSVSKAMTDTIADAATISITI